MRSSHLSKDMNEAARELCVVLLFINVFYDLAEVIYCLLGIV